MGSRALRLWVTHQLVERLVRETVQALGPDARVAPLKGALLARTLYDRPEERPLVDVDLLLLAPSPLVALRRLATAGFTLTSWSADLHFQFQCERVPALPLDLHLQPLPPGYGRISAHWLVRDARVDASLYDVPLIVPDARRTFVAMLGAVVRDLLDLSPAHCPEDIARIVERSPFPPSDFALFARDAHFARASWVALGWALERRPSVALRSVWEALTPSPPERRRALRWRQRLQSAAARTPPGSLAWALPPLGSDRWRDAAVGVAAFAAGIPIAAVHRRWWASP